MGIETFRDVAKDTMVVEADDAMGCVLVRLHEEGVGSAAVYLDERDVPRLAGQLFRWLAARSEARGPKKRKPSKVSR